MIQEQTIGNSLTAAMFDRTVSASGSYGHTATVGSSAQWVGLIVTFKSADASALLLRPRAEQFAFSKSSAARFVLPVGLSWPR